MSDVDDYDGGAVPVDEIDDLPGEIVATRLSYPERNSGVTIEGAPFSVEFQDPVDPEAFCEAVSTTDDPWNLFGIGRPIKADYWKLLTVLLHSADNHPEGSSKATLEVAPEWARIYVRDDASEARVADLVRTLDAEYNVEVRFPDD